MIPRIAIVTRRPAAMCRSTSPSSAARPGGGSTSLVPSEGEASSRRTRTIWSISPHGLARELLNGLERLARDNRGRARSERRPRPAWTRIVLIAWPAESCRSRAMRPPSLGSANRRSPRPRARRAGRAPPARPSAHAAGGSSRRQATPRPRTGLEQRLVPRRTSGQPARRYMRGKREDHDRRVAQQRARDSSPPAASQ